MTPIKQLIAEIRYAVERHGDDVAAQDALRIFKWLDDNAGQKWLEASKPKEDR